MRENSFSLDFALEGCKVRAVGRHLALSDIGSSLKNGVNEGMSGKKHRDSEACWHHLGSCIPIMTELDYLYCVLFFVLVNFSWVFRHLKIIDYFRSIFLMTDDMVRVSSYSCYMGLVFTTQSHHSYRHRMEMQVTDWSLQDKLLQGVMFRQSARIKLGREAFFPLYAEKPETLLILLPLPINGMSGIMDRGW